MFVTNTPPFAAQTLPLTDCSSNAISKTAPIWNSVPSQVTVVILLPGLPLLITSIPLLMENSLCLAPVMDCCCFNHQIPHIFENFMFVIHPTTKKFIRLALPKKLTACPGLDATLAFDPYVSPHYKVVFLWLNSNDCRHIAIYSSEMKSCGKVMATEYGKYGLVQGSGVFCNGKIYWVVKSGKTSLSFDVEQGFLNEYQLPLSYDFCGTTNRCFGASRGRLYLLQIITYLHYPDKASVYVYEFNEGCSGWVLTSKIGFKIYNLVLSYVCEEQDEGSTLLQLGGRRSNQIVAYNLKEKATKKVCDLNPLCNNRNIYPTANRLSGNIEWCSGACQLIETLS